MENRLLNGETDLEMLRSFLLGLTPARSVSDFDEQMQLPMVKEKTRLWLDRGFLVGFAYVDAYNNLVFEVASGYQCGEVANALVNWGVECMRARSAETGAHETLDACVGEDEGWKETVLVHLGFRQNEVRSLRYERFLDESLETVALPEGFAFRCVCGEEEVEALVGLHRAAFGTENMTVEERLAIMRAPGYQQTLDTVVIAPNGELAAFCIGGIEGGTGYTDPLGVAQKYQGLGLGKAIMSHVMLALKERGIARVEVGTSSENTGMQRLAEAVGFKLVSEKRWYSLQVD